MLAGSNGTCIQICVTVLVSKIVVKPRTPEAPNWPFMHFLANTPLQSETAGAFEGLETPSHKSNSFFLSLNSTVVVVYQLGILAKE